jgi:hypothetical protein
MVKVLFRIAVILCLIGCSDPKWKEAGTRVASMVGSSEFEVNRTSESTGSVYELSISEASWNKGYTDADVLSACALAFYNQIAPSEPVGFVRVVVAGRTKSVQQTYSFEELQQADRCIDRVNSFFKWKPEQGFDSVRMHIDPLFFPDSLLVKIGESVRQQDSLNNQFMHAEFIGFESDTVANLPVLTVKVKAIRKQSKQRYDAFVGMKNEKVLLVVPAEN